MAGWLYLSRGSGKVVRARTERGIYQLQQFFSLVALDFCTLHYTKLYLGYVNSFLYYNQSNAYALSIYKPIFIASMSAVIVSNEEGQARKGDLRVR